MEADSWNRPAGTSRRHLNALQSRFGEELNSPGPPCRGGFPRLIVLERCRISNNRGYRIAESYSSFDPEFSESFMGFEDVEIGEDDSRTEFPCPYCGEDFDMAGLCHHITDEHAIEAKSGVCPICEAKVGMDILDYVCHITMMHGNFLKMHRRRKFHRGSSMPHSTLSLLKRELRDGQLQSLFGSSSFMASSSNTAPDPLLSSFMYNSLGASSLKDSQPQTSEPKSIESKKVMKKAVDREEGSLSEKEQKERARRSGFVRGLVLSAVFGEDS